MPWRWLLVSALMQCGEGSTSLDGGVDASVDATNDASLGDASKDASSNDVASNDASDAGNVADCAMPPLHVPDGGPYCPGLPDASFCAGPYVCCQQTQPGNNNTPTYCGSGSLCGGSGKILDWQCDDTSQCSANQICCLFGFFAANACPTPVQLNGTYCFNGSSCPESTPKICASSSECDGGTCTPFVAYAGEGGEIDLGYCR